MVAGPGGRRWRRPPPAACSRSAPASGRSGCRCWSCSWPTWLVRRAGWRVLAATVAAAALPLAGYLAWFDHSYHRVAFSNSDGIYLWSRTMSFANCAVIKPPAGEAALCPPRAAARARRPPATSGHRDSPLDRVRRQEVLRGKNSLAMNFALRAIAAQPLRLPGRRAARRLALVRLEHPAAPERADDQALRVRLRHRALDLPRRGAGPGATPSPPTSVAYGGATATRAVQPFAGWLVSYQRVVYLRGTLLGGGARRRARRDRPPLPRRRGAWPAGSGAGRACTPGWPRSPCWSHRC